MKNAIMLACICYFFLFPRVNAEELLLQVGHVFDSNRGEWLNLQTILIRDNKIAEINPRKITKNVRVIDFKDAYILPGLIDAHTHLFLEDPTYGNNFSQGLLNFFQSHNDKSRLLIAQSRSASLLKFGFTAVRDLGNDGGSKGLSSGVRFYSSGPGHTPKLGQFPPNTASNIVYKEYARMDSNALKNLKHQKRKILKLYSDEDPNPTMTELSQLRLWINEAHKRGIKVAVHAISNQAIQNALDAGADSLEHGTFLNQAQLDQMARQGTCWVPSTGTKVLTRPEFTKLSSDHIPGELDLLCKNIQKAHKAGVTVVFGSDNYYSLEKYGVDFGQGTIEALVFMKDCGLPSSEVLKSATSSAARLLSDPALGSLNPGSYADFVVYKEDPLKNILALKKPFKVYVDGKEVFASP